MAQIIFERVSKTYEGGHSAVNELDLEIADGEFMVLVGPSGCGKSTALRMIAGLEDITGGRLIINGEVANELAPRDRNIAMVFQSYALYPHLTVAENIAFGLKVRRVPREAIEAKVRETAALLELTDFLNRKPAKLSGGQRQRVAMGRALVRSPNAFLMDEPLSNLDARLRGQMRAEIAKLQRMTAVTTVYVTHDQVEAMTMGHRVAVMNKGRLQQLDTPRRLYDKPVNLFVASFIGSPPINFLKGTLRSLDGGLAAQTGAFTLPIVGREGMSVGQAVVIGIRPEALRLVPQMAPTGGLMARAAFVEDLGATLLAHLDIADAEVVSPGVIEQEEDLHAIRPRLRVVLDGGLNIISGEALSFAVDPAAIHVFDAASGMAL
ncbi:sn-glycerol-3-phosphate ABC transporter ATP-binding protein UgpC [Devosia neptuniae]|uniref:Sn-glycerol-3-phosphate ABC transporter ATP-binding protein UgpC n=1 Tax=Devosia neptuniae TaxID=191302 RepID=A0ABY6C9A6_9HYPH|nr:sn-glycerol-3-phosphate ABC transporter ATP-binding protein UgpC [Devosia neptuniae]UXN68823.1 sn-glycerol-3-phosphate ABC transporter ATP-binding protein UgpC [Devosia neptuniae]